MSVRTLYIPIGGGPSPTNYYTKDEIDAMLDSYGAGFTMTMDGTTFVITASLKNADGDVLGTSQTIDLPLESVVVNGSYDSTNKKIILTLQNGTTIDVPVGDLVSGLQTEITSQNKLSADLVDDTSTTNKFVTASDLSDIAANTTARHTHSNKAILDATTASFTDSSYVHTDNNYTDSDKTKLANIEAGAQVNVQADWDAAAGTAAEILNKPTIPAAQVNSDWNASSGVAEILNKPTIPTVNDATITIRQSGQNDQTFTLNQGSNQTVEILNGMKEWFGTQAEFNALQNYYMDTVYYISDKIDWNTDIINAPSVPTRVSQLPNDANYQNRNQVKQYVDNSIKKAVREVEDKDVWLTQADYDALVLAGTVDDTKRYHIEGNQTTLPMVVTFTDSTTATYDVYVSQQV